MELQEFLDNVMPDTGEPLTNLALRVVAALFVVIAGRYVARFVSRFVDQGLRRAQVDDTLITFLGKLSYYILLILIIIIALGIVGVPTTSLVAILGAATLAIGLALQDSISNLASGVFIIILRPYRIGDYVDMDDEEGFVTEIRLFHTLITTRDNKSIFIPNKDIMGGKITNYTMTDLIRLDLVYGISYGDDVLKAKQIVEKILQSNDRIATQPEARVFVKELGDSSVNLAAWPYVKAADEPIVTFEVTEQVKLRFDEAGISIPFPQRDVHLYSVDSTDSQ